MIVDDTLNRAGFHLLLDVGGACRGFVYKALWADSLGPKSSSGATYVGSLEANTAALVSGLSGGRVRCRPRG